MPTTKVSGQKQKLKNSFSSGHLAKGEAYWILFLEQNLSKIKVGMMDVFDV